MPAKSFDLLVPFSVQTDENGDSQLIPVVTVSLLVPPTNWRYDVPLLFDTGASQIMLRKELYPFLGLLAPDDGEEVQVETLTGAVTAHRYNIQIEVFGKLMDCPVHLVGLAEHPLYQGLLGREAVFQHFGFGFWESTQELFVSLAP